VRSSVGFLEASADRRTDNDLFARWKDSHLPALRKADSSAPCLVEALLQFGFGPQPIIDEPTQSILDDSVSWCAAMCFTKIYEVAFERLW
jgi:hypothetical protein